MTIPLAYVRYLAYFFQDFERKELALIVGAGDIQCNCVDAVSSSQETLQHNFQQNLDAFERFANQDEINIVLSNGEYSIKNLLTLS